jgi:hypothetical protein
LPVFIVIFRLLERMTSKNHYQIFDPRRILNNLPNPHYLAHGSSLYQHLVRDHGSMMSFGMDLAKSARDHHGSVSKALPYYALIVVMTASQYVQQQQMNKRNPQAANANPQMKITMQLFPAFYAFISINIPASVVLYLLVSGLYRMAQNTLSYTYDPKLKLASTPVGGVIEVASKPGRGDGGSEGGGGGRGPGRGGPKGPGGGNGVSPKGVGPGAGADAGSKDKDAKAPPGASGTSPPKGAVNVRPGRATPRGTGPRRRGR